MKTHKISNLLALCLSSLLPLLSSCANQDDYGYKIKNGKIIYKESVMPGKIN